MTIVRTTYRYKPPPKRKRAQAAAIENRIVTAKNPKRLKGPVIRLGQEPPPPEAESSRIVTAKRKPSSRFGPVQDFDAEEHQRRGDAAAELFRELVRRATASSDGP